MPPRPLKVITQEIKLSVSEEFSSSSREYADLGYNLTDDDFNATTGQCAEKFGKCGGGTWDPVGYPLPSISCCDPEDTCYWKNGSGVRAFEKAYAQ